MTAGARITKAQRLFLAGYLPDILHGDNASLVGADRATFICKVAGMDFDDGAACSAGAQRVARNLQQRGLLSELDVHADIAGQPHIFLVFSTAGAEALFEIHTKGQ